MSNISGLLGEFASPLDLHVKATLPPSLNDLPEHAAIRYYVKATVQRPAFYKENFRTVRGFDSHQTSLPPRQVCLC